MRHTFGAWLATRGISLHTIQILLGHSSITVTEKFYASLMKDNLATAVGALEPAGVVPTGVPTRALPAAGESQDDRQLIEGGIVAGSARVAEQADARDLKSLGP